VQWLRGPSCFKTPWLQLSGERLDSSWDAASGMLRPRARKIPLAGAARGVAVMETPALLWVCVSPDWREAVRVT
jgi:hypothetical protein